MQGGLRLPDGHICITKRLKRIELIGSAEPKAFPRVVNGRARIAEAVGNLREQHVCVAE